MNLEQIIVQAREWLDDEREPYLWTAEQLTRWANEAQLQVALRTRCLVDATTADVCTVNVVAGQAAYPLHPSIVLVRRFQYDRTGSAPEVLRRVNANLLDRHEGGRWTSLTGRPWRVAQDLRSRYFRLDRIPTADDVGTITMTVWRKPLDSEQLEAETDEPVVDEAHHLNMAHWVCYRAYLKRDEEAYNPNESARHLQQFDAAFGQAPTLQRLIELAVDDPGEVEAHWY